MKKTVKIFTIIFFTTFSIIIFAETGGGGSSKPTCTCLSDPQRNKTEEGGTCKNYQPNDSKKGAWCDRTTSATKDCYATQCTSINNY